MSSINIVIDNYMVEHEHNISDFLKAALRAVFVQLEIQNQNQALGLELGSNKNKHEQDRTAAAQCRRIKQSTFSS